MPPTNLKPGLDANFDGSALNHADSYIDRIKEEALLVQQRELEMSRQPDYFGKVSDLDISGIREEYRQRLNQVA